MSKAFRPKNYFDASLERASDAQLLLRQRRYALSLYISGLSVESMIRAFRTLDEAQFDEKHDLVQLLKGCDQRRFGRRRADLHQAVSTIWKAWRNDYRFSSRELVLARLRKSRLTRGIEGNAVKFYATEALDAAHTVLKIGRKSWPSKTN